MSANSNAEIIRAFTIAMETELRGLETYLNFARTTIDTTGKNMFIVLARDEYEHFRTLSDARSKMEINEKLEHVEIPESLFQRVVPKIRERDARVQGENGADQITALKAAMDQERRSIELYRKQLSKTITSEARQVFQQLVEIEEAHFDIIQAELDSINETGFWFQIPEFSMED